MCGVCVVNVCVVYNYLCVCVCVYFCPLFRCIHRKPIKAFCSVDTMLYIIHSVYAVEGAFSCTYNDCNQPPSLYAVGLGHVWFTETGYQAVIIFIAGSSE